MTRLRDKGGASPDTLFDLLNGYVGPNKAPKQRPGTRWVFTFPPNTKGLCAYKGKIVAFSAGVIATGDPNFIVKTLRHPDSAFDGELKDIHYAQPFLGLLYVVAEFDDDQVFHYYLQEPDAWIAEHPYLASDIVQPTTPNGYYYKPATDLTPPAWSANVQRAIGDIVQPTISTGWKYTCTAVSGTNPRSGETEPVWPTTDGATVTEYVEAGPPPEAPSSPPTNPNDPNDGRYSNPGGSGGGTRSQDRPNVRLF